MKETQTEKKVCEVCGTGYLKGFEGTIHELRLFEVDGTSIKHLKICGECLARLSRIEPEEDKITTVELREFEHLEIAENIPYLVDLTCYNCEEVKGSFIILRENDKIYLNFGSLRSVKGCETYLRQFEILGEDNPQIWCERCEERNLYTCGDCGQVLYSDETEVLDDEIYCPDCYLGNILEDSPKVYRKPLTFEIARKSLNFSKQYRSEEQFKLLIKPFGWELGEGMKTWSSWDGSELPLYNDDDLQIEVKEMLEKEYEYIPILVAVHPFCVNVSIIYRKRN